MVQDYKRHVTINLKVEGESPMLAAKQSGKAKTKNRLT
jgi:hypothetical protein